MLSLQPHKTRWPLVHILMRPTTKSGEKEKTSLTLFNCETYSQQVVHFPVNLASTFCCLYFLSVWLKTLTTFCGRQRLILLLLLTPFANILHELEGNIDFGTWTIIEKTSVRTCCKPDYWQYVQAEVSHKAILRRPNHPWGTSQITDNMSRLRTVIRQIWGDQITPEGSHRLLLTCPEAEDGH